jgi:hypothetical protein
MSDTHLREWLTKGLKLFAIALGCLAAFAIFFVVWLKTGLVRVHIQRPWFFLIAWTGFLFWFVCQQLWKDVRRPRFWIALIAAIGSRRSLCDRAQSVSNLAPGLVYVYFYDRSAIADNCGQQDRKRTLT